MKIIIKIIVNFISIILGLILMLFQGKSYVGEAANGNNRPFYYFLVIVIIAIVFFIMIPLILNIVINKSIRKPLLLRFIFFFAKNSKSNGNYKSLNNKQNSTIKNNDDRIYEYFVYNYSIEDIIYQKTEYNYNVYELQNSIIGILDETRHLTKELLKYKNSDMRNKLAAIKTSNNNVTIEYLSDNNIEITSGIIKINVPLYKCKTLNNFFVLSPYLKSIYMKTNFYTI